MVFIMLQLCKTEYKLEWVTENEFWTHIKHITIFKALK